MKQRFLFLFTSILIVCNSSPARASFHLMQIEQVVGGVNGNTNAQAIQLRMRSIFPQNFVAAAHLVAWDAAGQNPVTIIDFTTNVLNGTLGAHILIASAGLAGATNPSAAADFIMTNPIPVSYLNGGSLTFEADFGNVIYWRLSWGNYVGPTTGSLTNDADGDFGPPFNGALPSGADLGLLFTGAAGDLSSSNLFDYRITSVAAVLTNNAGQTFTVAATTDAVPAAQVLPLSNYPNPFNPSTKVSFTMEQAGPAVLRVYDGRGHLVKTLFQGVAPQGTQQVTWRGQDAHGNKVAAGIYAARLVTAYSMQVRKLILIK